MLKKLVMTTALSGLMMSAALAQAVDTKPIDTPAAKSPPAATAPRIRHPGGQVVACGDRLPHRRCSAGSAQFVNTQKPDQWLASKFKGTDVIGADNEKIGDMSDILFDKAGKIEAFIVSVGGFLGMGAKDVALAPAAFQVVTGDESKNESDKLKLASMTKDQLKQAANFEPYNPPRTTTGMGGHAAPGAGSAGPARSVS